MHARELIEVAVMVSHRNRTKATRFHDVDAHFHNYWIASRSRLYGWHDALQRFCEHQRRGGGQLMASFGNAQPIIHEILMSEVLTRVWAAESAWYDIANDSHEYEPIARNVFISHEEARHRTLTLMARGTGITAEELVALNRLRRSCERWTDLLLGNYANELDVSHLAFDQDRVVDYAAETHRDTHRQKQQWQLLAASARVAFQVRSSAASATPHANRQIAQSISPFLVPGETVSQTRAAFEERIDDIAVEAQRMLDDLILLEQ